MSDSGSSDGWRIVSSPTSKSLYEVVGTADGPYAVASGGLLIGNRGNGWEVILEEGPAGKNKNLRTMAVTEDGKRVWFGGSSGVLGCWDVDEQQRFDYSFPEPLTKNWSGLTVHGKKGSEKGLVASASGQTMAFSINGFDITWGAPMKVSGNALTALDASPDGVGYAVDASSNAYRTTKDDGWEKIGVVNTGASLYGIYAAGYGRVLIAGGNGDLHRYDDSYQNWTPVPVADTTLYSVDGRNLADGSEEKDGQLITVGGSGTVYRRVGDTQWQAEDSATSKNLYDVTTLPNADVAVGSSGRIVRRPFDGTSSGSSGSWSWNSGSSSGSSSGGTGGSSSDGTADDGDSTSSGSTSGGSGSNSDHGELTLVELVRQDDISIEKTGPNEYVIRTGDSATDGKQ